MRRTCHCLFLTLLLAAFTCYASAQESVASVVKRSKDAVVEIVVSNQQGEQISLGSGFIVSEDGNVVTNYHVIKDAHSAIAKLADGSSLSVEGILAIDPYMDLAVVKVQGSRLPSLRIISTLHLQVGDHVVAIGSPLGLEGTVSDGIVSALRADEMGKHWIQTTAAVSPGNSGGPLLDMHGGVVGVIAGKVSSQEGQNLNFAIPSDEVEAIISVSSGLSPHACASGNWEACNYLSVNLATHGGMLVGTLMGSPFSKAAQLFEHDCAVGKADACDHLAWMYLSEEGVRGDGVRAMALFSKACDGGVAPACDRLGIEYAFSGAFAKDYSQAVAFYTKACNSGNAIGCFHEGQMYNRGMGVSRDDARAKMLFTKACSSGVDSGCSELERLSKDR